jgi:hypothetical protein
MMGRLDRDPLPNEKQIRALGELLHAGFIFMLCANEAEGQALAYALHNVPVEIYGWGVWSISQTRGRLKRFQAGHYPRPDYGPDFVAMFDAVFPPSELRYDGGCRRRHRFTHCRMWGRQDEGRMGCRAGLR